MYHAGTVSLSLHVHIGMSAHVTLYIWTVCYIYTAHKLTPKLTES